MFENIIGQAATLATLKEELREGCFPAAALLHGPEFCGKLSTALEIARVLTCTGGGDWSCGCPACRKQRLLVHPGTLLLGFRYFELEIAAAADVLRRVPRLSSLYLFARAVRKLTRRFDPLIWEGDENKIRPVGSTLAEVEDRLDALIGAGGTGEGPEVALPAEMLERATQKIQALIPPLARVLSADTVPVAHLRRASAWLHLTPLAGAGARKVVILENADRMYDASSNSLLKILEEPPSGAHLVLTTTRRGSMMPTVLSRLRPYLLRERSAAEEQQVLERIFQEHGTAYRGLREYFLYWRQFNPQQLQGLARRFAEAACAPQGGEGDGAAALLEELREAASGNARLFAASFLDELLREQRLLLRGAERWRVRRWAGAVRSSLDAMESYNQSPALVLEALLYTLRGIG